MITRKIIIKDFYLSLCKSFMSDVVSRLVGAILFGRQAKILYLLVTVGRKSAAITAAAAAVVAAARPPLGLQLDSQDNTGLRG